MVKNAIYAEAVNEGCQAVAKPERVNLLIGKTNRLMESVDGLEDVIIRMREGRENQRLKGECVEKITPTFAMVWESTPDILNKVAARIEDLTGQLADMIF